MAEAQQGAEASTQHLTLYHSGKEESCNAFVRFKRLDCAQGSDLWLGQGMYFWDNLGCAKGWQVKRTLPSIVAADVCLAHMIDMTDPSQRYGIGLVMDHAAKSFESKVHQGHQQYFGDVLDFLLKKPPYRDVLGRVDVIKAIGTHGWEGIQDRSFADMCWKQDPHLIFNANVEYCVKN